MSINGGNGVKKKIRVKFLDVVDDPENNFIVDILKERYDVEISENPEYLFFESKSKGFLDYNCVRIFYTPENLVPDFNICDYAMGFNYIDFQDRYIRYPIYMLGKYNYYAGDDYALDLERTRHKHENVKLQLENKTDFCSFVYSNADAAKCREKIFSKLSEYKQVNSGGRYNNNVGGPISSKLEFQKKHKFVIAFENTAGYGYTTEKIVHAFSAGAIPIYWGNPAITKEFNENSFIDCNKMGLTEKGEDGIIDKIVDKVIELDNNDSAYLRMLETPAFLNQNYVEEKQAELIKFLYNIFDQPFEKAFRRNRFYWGERYERRQKIGEKFYWECRKLIPVRDALHKIVKR